MRAVVVGFDAALGIGRVDVEGIEVGTDLLCWCKVLVVATFCQLANFWKTRLSGWWVSKTCPTAAPVSST